MKERIQQLIDQFIPNSRKREYRKFAKEFGFGFKRRASLKNQNFGIQGFKIMKSNYWNELIGIIDKLVPELDAQLRVYDYTRSDNVGQHQTTIIELKCKNLGLDKFQIMPKSKINKLKSLIIDPLNTFEDDFKLEALDKEQIIYRLGESALELIKSNKKIQIEGQGDYILLYYKHKKIAMHDLLEIIDFAKEILNQILFHENEDNFV